MLAAAASPPLSAENKDDADASRPNKQVSGGEPAFEGVVCPREHDEEQGVRQGIGQEAAGGEGSHTGNAFS